MSNISDNDIFENRSVCNFGSYQDIPSPLEEPMESDTLGVTTSSLNSLPIGCQLNALRQLRQPRATGDLSDPSQSRLATVTLQEPQALWELVNIFFQEFESYFPCLNQAVIYERLSMVLSLHGYEHGNHRIVIGPEHCKIIAILLNMLAYAESLTRPVESCKPRPVPQSYLQGLKLMQYFNKLHEADLGTVIYHTTSSAFLLEMSMHHMALQSITQGFQIALKIGLNNQTLWPNDDSDLVSRQGLWWTLYFLDKRITQKCGITYFLREDESAVSDFSKLKNHMGSSKYDLLQSLISFSRLWAYIWDGFFSPQAPKVDDWGESQMMDTRIVLSYRQVPPNLHWKSSKVAEYMCLEGETQIRQRLIVFLRFQSLRLSIRHKPLTSTEHDIERRQTSVSICEAIIEAIQSYMTMTTSLRPSGYILTTSLVEILYHIVPEECDPKPIFSVELLKGMVCSASQLLQTLSNSVATASHVYQYLRDLLPPYDRFRPLDGLTASPPSQNGANQKAHLDCSADLDTLSETFWRTIVDRPGQDRSPAGIHSEPNNQGFLPFSMAMSKNPATDCLPFKVDDFQCQLLMNMDLEDIAFKAQHALPMDYSTTHFGGDLL
ncbi:uncharacterized protein N7443_009916 [Penicillium atrosanguineum]|uniref:uncharacterized protein n=1 Tax=Penicillium atrosanguineum TaxID=1132637 RepID=UPI0023A16F4E|nr:uncharacterized protein N7443_009916 [Penicillium atrosanguineum]KAJ5289663.1 hypothetical protein N7443_009916 [Penicillium atrosanguineum]